MIKYVAQMNTGSLDIISRNLVSWLKINRLLGPAVAVLIGFFPQQNQNPVVAFLVGIVSAILSYVMTTWWAEWVERTSASALHGSKDQMVRVRQLADTLGRWVGASRVIMIIIGSLGAIALLIIGSLGTGTLSTGFGPSFILLALVLGLMTWAAYVSIGYLKNWIADATAWVETGRITSAFEPLSKSLRKWYTASLVISGFFGIIFVISSLIVISALGAAGLISLSLRLATIGVGLGTLWYWRSFFGAFTAHVTGATQTQSNATSPASL